MSRELFKAASDGNLDAVKHELKTANINYTAVIQLTPTRKVTATPLTISLINKHYQVAEYLINAGAMLEKADNVYSEDDCYLYGFPLVCFFPVETKDLNHVVQLIMSKVTCLNPIIINQASQTSLIDFSKKCISQISDLIQSISLRDPFNLQSLRDPFEQTYLKLYYRILLRFILHESLIRNHEETYSAILGKEWQPKIDTASFVDFLNHRSVNAENLLLTGNALVNARHYKLKFTDIEILEILAAMKQKAGINNVCITDFSVATWNHLPRHTTSDLNTLASELFYLLFPDEYCSPFHAESEAFKNSWGRKLSASECEAFRQKQEPVNLRKILGLDTLEIIMRLSSSTSHLRDNYNPAVNNLAEIIMYHASTLIAVNDKEEPLFTAAQCADFIKIINSFYNMSHAEKLMLRTRNMAEHPPREATGDTQNLAQTVDELKTQLVRMEEKLDKVLMLFSRQVNLGQQEVMKPRPGMF